MAAQDENELYAQWLKTDPANRRDIEAKLYAAVKSHVQAVLWKLLNEPAPDLVHEAANAVMMQLGGFRQKSKFSTWVEGIARHKAKQYIRGKVRARKVFDEYVKVVEIRIEDDYAKPRAKEVVPTVFPQLDGEIRVHEFRKSLSQADAELLRYKEQGLKSKQIAERTGTTVEAVDSRWARLKPKLKKFHSTRRK